MTTNGLDVSGYQTPGTWAGMNPSFVWAKASEGEKTTDPVFAGHVAQAHTKGAVCGAYHFGWPLNPVAADVANFVHAVSGAVSAGRVHMLALDLEPYSDRRNTRGLTPGFINSWAAEWVRLVKGKFPHLRVGIYADTSVFQAGWVPRGADFYWVAAYPTAGLTYSSAAQLSFPKLGPGFPAATFWQFTDQPFDLDLSAFRNADELRAWAGSAPAGSPQPKPGPGPGGTYTVRPGDTMSGIAAAHHVSLSALESANPQVRDPNVIIVGQVLRLPAGASSGPAAQKYTVRWGDTLSGIAAAHGVSLAQMEAANPAIRNANLIYVGQVLTIPARS